MKELNFSIHNKPDTRIQISFFKKVSYGYVNKIINFIIEYNMNVLNFSIHNKNNHNRSLKSRNLELVTITKKLKCANNIIYSYYV